jgi:pyruvate,orthophosphate dikinase
MESEKERGAGERIFKFGNRHAGKASREAFGNKAAGLSVMVALGVPVPPGFVLNVSICEEYFENDRQLPEDVPALLREGISFLENATRKFFGGRPPLLVSVRSGASVSMPGSMETLLNVGMTRETVSGMIARTGNPRFAWDSYRRLVEGFGSNVFFQDPAPYRELLKGALAAQEVPDEVELDFCGLRELSAEYEKVFQDASGMHFPGDPYEQLELAVKAVLDSWMSPRAREYRRINGIKGARGTAVTVQAMVFGNMGMNSGAGIAFTRNPWTGENVPVIDFKFGAQGEDVVSGAQAASHGVELQTAIPRVFRELEGIGKKLETHFRDMQDLEFTVEEGRLYLLQNRSGKRSPLAALRIAVDLWKEGILTTLEAVKQLEEVDIDSICVQEIKAEKAPLAKGDSASCGVASGRIALGIERARAYAKEGPVILIRETPSPDDIPGIHAASGLLTSRGARTAHAVVVARQMGKVCIVNCRALKLKTEARICVIGEKEFREGDIISLDGASGTVYEGEVEVKYEKPVELLGVVETWKKEIR